MTSSQNLFPIHSSIILHLTRTTIYLSTILTEYSQPNWSLLWLLRIDRGPIGLILGREEFGTLQNSYRLAVKTLRSHHPYTSFGGRSGVRLPKAKA